MSHGFLVVKAAAESDGSRGESKYDQESTHFSPPNLEGLSLKDFCNEGCDSLDTALHKSRVAKRCMATSLSFWQAIR
jgi:hypothetical protein